MIEDIFEMHKRAKAEATSRLEAGDFRGYVAAMTFAYQCKKFATELLTN